MRWTSRNPSPGERKTVRRFAWLPTSIEVKSGGYYKEEIIVWLEFYNDFMIWSSDYEYYGIRGTLDCHFRRWISSGKSLIKQ